MDKLPNLSASGFSFVKWDKTVLLVWLLKRDKGVSHRRFINKLLTPFSLIQGQSERGLMKASVLLRSHWERVLDWCLISCFLTLNLLMWGPGVSFMRRPEVKLRRCCSEAVHLGFAWFWRSEDPFGCQSLSSVLFEAAGLSCSLLNTAG